MVYWVVLGRFWVLFSWELLKNHLKPTKTSQVAYRLVKNVYINSDILRTLNKRTNIELDLYQQILIIHIGSEYSQMHERIVRFFVRFIEPLHENESFESIQIVTEPRTIFSFEHLNMAHYESHNSQTRRLFHICELK